jgi:hypothetical protein
MPPRVAQYHTILPSRAPRRRFRWEAAGSVVLHTAILTLIIYQTTRGPGPADPARALPEAVRPVQLVFAPPRPTPTPRAAPPDLPPPVPLAEGPDATPGSTARLNPTPEEEPNAAPDTPRIEATRPDPGESDRSDEGTTSPPPTIAAPAPASPSSQPALETEARRIFGRPSSKLGPVSGQRDNRPWETPLELSSRGCTLPPPDPSDSTLPPGMGSIAGRIFNERTGEPLAGARLQILGTPYGTFSDGQGAYRLVFDRSLVSQCRTQAVRVTAPGYRGRDVLLYLGATPNGDVPMARN